MPLPLKASAIQQAIAWNKGASGTLPIRVTSNSMKAITPPGRTCEASRLSTAGGLSKYGKTKRPTKAS